jgi:allophanate hydrolase subunit 2
VGQHVKFREISLEIAERVYLKQEKEIKRLKTSVALYK